MGKVEESFNIDDGEEEKAFDLEPVMDTPDFEEELHELIDVHDPIKIEENANHIMLSKKRKRDPKKKTRKGSNYTKQLHICEICSYETHHKKNFDRHLKLTHFDQNGYKKCNQCKELILKLN